MSKKEMITIDGNEAVALVAHKTNEVIAIYPITPSSSMGELSDEWSAAGKKNIWGTVPLVIEMQSEGGAAGAVHGALQAGSLTTTFTASQGLLLMIPNMYKIAGELTSTVFHVSARTVATHALSIFGDHGDILATRATGWALLASGSVQEAHDFALISQAATLESRVPFVHFFEGFRVSHEVAKIAKLGEDDLRAMLDEKQIAAHRARALSPERPVLRGSAQNPDVFFQAREACNPFYLACPDIVQNAMDKFGKLTGRQYRLFEYFGAPDADRVIVAMGCGAHTAVETAKYLNERGEKTGVLIVRLFRPFSAKHLVKLLPAAVKTIAVLDRTKEPGGAGEPLYQDVITAIAEGLSEGFAPFAKMPRIIGGRYGLSSKEFTPAMVKGIFDEMKKDRPKNHFVSGIEDDVTNTSIAYDPKFSVESQETIRSVFIGLGSDGTVGANKNSIKIIGEETDNYAQGYFVYDSKKSGSVTVSHLRFGPQPIVAPYLVSEANFVGCHQFSFLERVDVLKYAMPGGVFLLNSMYGPDEVWENLPKEVQEGLIQKKLRFYVIDAYKVAEQTDMGRRINTIMQTCFFAISGVLPREQAIVKIKDAIKKTYGGRGEAVVKRNFDAVDKTLANLYEVKVPAQVSSTTTRRPAVSPQSPPFVRNVLGKIIDGAGDDLPVSAFPVDGTFPTATACWEKRNIALEMPVWDPNLCIQCGKCVFVCPHAVIRAKAYPASALTGAPRAFLSTDAKWKELPNMKFTITASPEDCTGCALCHEVCPAKDKVQAGRKAVNMEAQPAIRERENEKWDFFSQLPDMDRTILSLSQVKNTQLLRPLFEFSGACAGCGETPYVILLSKLFGERSLIANATGCSSIYGGNLPTTPWCVNKDGRGPAWANSLFEDNAEFGLGMRLTIDKQNEHAKELLPLLADHLGEELVTALLRADQTTEKGILEQRGRVQLLREKLAHVDNAKARELLAIADFLVMRSVWIVGGDGWAYDIGYGGLDHVLASGRNVKLVVLDTEVYSNTGGQASKSTPIGAVAKFAANGKAISKKDIGLMAMSYGYVYVAHVAFGANDQQTLKALLEADAYNGPALIIAYSHCIAHGYDLRKGLEQQKLAVQCGLWPLYRFDPRLAAEGKNPLVIDSKEATITVDKYAYNETRYRMLQQSDAKRAGQLMKDAQKETTARWSLYQQMAAMRYQSAPTASEVKTTEVKTEEKK